jgi:hypothetical protein
MTPKPGCVWAPRRNPQQTGVAYLWRVSSVKRAAGVRA